MAGMMEGASLFLDGDTIDGLEFSIDTLIEILNEDPGPSQSHSPPGNQSFHHGNVACDQADPERSSRHQAGALESAEIPEDFRRLGFPPWESSNYMTIPDHKVERGLIGSSNSLDALYDPLPADNGNLHSSQIADLKNFYSYPSNYSYEWPSSSGQNSYFMDSIGGSFETFVPGNFDQQQFQNNIPISSALAESAEEVGLIHAQNSDFVNNFSFDSELEDFRQIEDSLHAMPMEKSGSGNALHNNLNKGIMSDAGVQEGNLPASLLVSSAINSDVTSAEADYAEVNPTDTTYAPCDPCNNSVLLPRGSATDMDRALRQSRKCFQTFVSNSDKSVPHCIIEREDQQLASQKICRSNEVKLPTQKESLNSLLQEGSNLEASLLNKISTNANQHQDMSFKGESSTDSSPISSGRNSSTSDSICKSAINKSKHFVHDVGTNMLNRMENVLLKEEREDQALVPHWKQYDISKGIGDAVHKNPSKNTLIVDDDDDDDDVCILNDISGPAHSFPPLVHIKPHPVPITQRSGLSDPHYAELVGMRLKSDEERLTFRIALQGLSEPKMEATPPDGVLAVPLLRHQRIALSWMVQKETASLNCSGGILADDQGLGKTVSTIALILMERSPSSISCSMMGKQEYEALNLDDDDEDADYEPKSLKLAWSDHPTVMDMPIKRENPSMVAKSRPAAGTLVVCPTSVIRQWAEELQNKVSSKANLSFLVYHGSNRTKDPHELAKYDVVLTTYAIVSMEVPKQPLLDEDDEDRVKPGASRLSMGHFLGKKRKRSSNSDEKNSKESTLPESAARPLAKVGWFRVILDEAQSIKNHRTQVARACWGLRAKRRWCLSGTPIQNAVDDLYSYFRFLRYDPYAIYKSFCSTIKAPISKNPTTGYRKLQAVLKTIMLRRTKGTLIDGKPIITLPPKFVTLKKVDFSLEERAFYSTLEAESREQFKEYAAAGTVKQNYVNILLMLLRLRQACDHPLLVKGYDSNATQRSSMALAKKLPRDKQTYLLSCLEACLAICTICNDPPEDAVVTICGHVFCNQCISDHLTGDDNICPSGQCKFQLCSASVFSRGTLKSSPAGLTDHGGCSGDSSPEGLDEHKQHEDSIPSGSSKIKAAIEILCSLPICHDPPSTSDFEKSNNVTKELLTNGDNTACVRCSQGIHDTKPSELKNGSTSQVTEKAIVFSQWTRMLDMLEVPLKDSSVQYRRLDGTMSVAARDKAVKDFNTRPEVTVMIMSLKAASLGLNMVAACHVLLLDLWWNPTTEDQAIDRAHRIGQTRPVTVSRLTVRDTVEDRILDLQKRKREMVASAFGEDESGSRQTRLTEEDLKYLFMV